ncbi:beta-ketoacyl synthase N-terminal-like domain-containing protein [uncultured Alistipes sp.]|uniref:beta-ketoacyl synthase N-terminal-like domain-containing protein n=1 Tax=uncultured Alistipes sp. TaxID=538949 RepID=UPI0025CE8951|nr:beta-ketoacyl synthase N-terminal-like domain-containing protein [uncultured Alistipes sp.]
MAQVAIYLGADRIISACGFTTAENADAIARYELGVKAFTDPTLAEDVLTAGRIDREHLHLPDGCTDFEALLSEAIKSVVAESGIDPNTGGTRLIIATTKGNIDLLRNDPKPDPRCFIAEAAQRTADRLGFAARPIVISNACISGIAALIVARRMIGSGQCTDVVVAGADILSEFVVTGFRSFKSVSDKVCRPYDKQHAGLSLGEACGAVLLTSDRAKAKGEPILLAGGAMTQDANHLSAPSRTGEELAGAIGQAMCEAGITPGEISFVNAHGTATLYNDEMECKALHLAGLGDVPLNSLKPYLGHTLGAAGVVETILTAEQLRQGIVFGTPGYLECGTPMPLNVTSHHREIPLSAAVKTASGFGGCNAAVVLSRKARQESCSAPTQHIRQTGSYTLINDGEPFAERIRREYRSLEAPNMRFSKMDDLSKLGYVAAEKLLAAGDLLGRYDVARVGIVLANRSASLDTDIRHQRVIESRPEEGTSPAIFVYTLPNIVSAEISIRHGIKGEGLFFLESAPGNDSFAMDYARQLIATGKLDAVICGWCDYLGENYEVQLNLLEKI